MTKKMTNPKNMTKKMTKENVKRKWSHPRTEYDQEYDESKCQRKELGLTLFGTQVYKNMVWGHNITTV